MFMLYIVYIFTYKNHTFTNENVELLVEGDICAHKILNLGHWNITHWLVWSFMVCFVLFGV